MLESRLLFAPIYYFGTNPNDTRGCDESANCSAFITISLEITVFKLFQLNLIFLGIALV
jgi:hypothetical protein